jgi:UDP:flavonoid glycosyltransferase YjiC (YdhE family)
MNSLIEANVFGIPIICIALFGDQTRNCKMVEDRGLSINLQKTALSKESLSDAIHELVRTKK